MHLHVTAKGSLFSQVRCNRGIDNRTALCSLRSEDHKWPCSIQSHTWTLLKSAFHVGQHAKRILCEYRVYMKNLLLLYNF